VKACSAFTVIPGKRFVSCASAAHVLRCTLRCGSRNFRLLPRYNVKSLQPSLLFMALALMGAALISASAFANAPKQLPASRPCEPNDLKRPWRLDRLWEDPEGTYLREYRAYPHQYLVFLNDHEYLSYYSPKRPENQQQLFGWMQGARQRAGASLHYILTEKGALYLYRGKHLMAATTCNIATERKGRFRVGWMWLYQPMSAPDIKLVRLFAPIRVNPTPPPATPNAPLAQGDQ